MVRTFLPNTAENLFDGPTYRWMMLLMKTLIALLVVSFQILRGADAPLEKKSASSGVEIDKETADSIKTFSVNQFNATAEGVAIGEGQILRIKFGYHQRSMENINGEVYGTISDPDSYVRNKTGSSHTYLSIVIPPEGLKWFNAVTTNGTKKNMSTVIGCVFKSERGTRLIRTLGREIQSDSKRTRIVWTK